MIGLLEKFEPEIAHLRQDTALVGYSRGEHPVECADAVAADEQ